MGRQRSRALENPFTRLEAGRLLVYVAVSVIASGLSSEIVPLIWPEASSALQGAVFGLLWSALLLALLIRAGRRASIAWPRLFGRSPSVRTLSRLTTTAIPLAAISVDTQFLVLLPLSYLMPAWVGTLLLERCQSVPASGPDRWVSGTIDAAVAILLAPVTEELLCRGYLLHRWGLKWSTRRAVLLTSVVFGVLHLELEQVVSGFVHGLAFSLMYLETRSLLVPVAVHAANNALASLASLLPIGSICSVAALRSWWWEIGRAHV